MSGSSTRKVAQSWQNSPNSISPDPSSSISSSRSFSSSSVGLKPMALMISPRSSTDRKSTFLVSNKSKQVFKHLISSGASGSCTGPGQREPGHQESGLVLGRVHFLDVLVLV